MKRPFDLICAALLSIVLAIPTLIIVILIRISSKGPTIHWSDRVGRYNSIFKMPKFRTMKIDTPQIATHLMNNPNDWITPVGGYLRKYSLDEFPQLWSILKGDMSFVGPRPALYNQKDLVKLRTEKGVNSLTPGLTGWAQINGRDELSIREKVSFDEYYLQNQSFWFDFKIIILTIIRVFRKKDISH